MQDGCYETIDFTKQKPIFNISNILVKKERLEKIGQKCRKENNGVLKYKTRKLWDATL